MKEEEALFSSEESEQLILWFRTKSIAYPWGENPSFYRVWISEIMLQQTVVTAVVPFFLRWMEQFPDLKTLAASDEQVVVRCWEGLGYYSRARNIHKASRIIVERYDGHFPENYNDLVSLPGIGDYTACAILSMVKGDSLPVLDANVKRILCRLQKRSTWSAKEAERDTVFLKKSFYQQNPGEFNAAMMQFGQLVCRKKNPDCLSCFLVTRCEAFQSGTPEKYPEALKKKIIEKQTELALLLNPKNELFCIYTEKGIGSGLWKFPTIEAVTGIFRIFDKEALSKRTHNYTHYRDRLAPYLVLFSQKIELESPGKWISLDDIDSYPFPAVYRKIIEEVKKSR